MSGFDEAGTRDAAVLLLALGEETAAEVFKHLTPKEVQGLGEVMARTQYTTKDHIEQVLERFHQQASKQSTLVHDPNAYVRGVLKRALGDDKAGMLIDRIVQGSDVSGIESLASVAELIRHEHPQIIASILVHLERDHASSILQQLSAETRSDVMLRIATLDSIQPSALKELNEVLSRVLTGGDKVKRPRLGGSKAAAEILNFLGGGEEASLLETLRAENAELAQEIEDLMFTFDDLREVQNDQLIIALKGAEPALREKIFKNMSSRAAESLKEDLESRGPVRLSEVEAQQKEILKTVKRLADEGTIVVSSGGAADPCLAPPCPHQPAGCLAADGGHVLRRPRHAQEPGAKGRGSRTPGRTGTDAPAGGLVAERPSGRSGRSHRAAASRRGAARHDGSCPCRFAAGRLLVRTGCTEGRAGPRGDDPGHAAGRTHRLRTDPDLEGRTGSGTGRIDEAYQRTVPPPGSKRASGRCGDRTTVVCRQSPGNRRQGAGIWQVGARRLHTGRRQYPGGQSAGNPRGPDLCRPGPG